jgi:hypothetical protein
MWMPSNAKNGRGSPTKLPHAAHRLPASAVLLLSRIRFPRTTVGPTLWFVHQTCGLRLTKALEGRMTTLGSANSRSCACSHHETRGFCREFRLILPTEPGHAQNSNHLFSVKGLRQHIVSAKIQSFGEIQMAPVRSSVHIPVATLWAHFQGGDVDKGLAGLDKQANVMIDDLLWWTAALKAARER